jgi:hypothetical protein
VENHAGLTSPRLIWIAGGETTIFSSACFPSKSATTFLAITTAWAPPGLAALWAPESATSPSAKMCG